jgi:hypothetical protein
MTAILAMGTSVTNILIAFGKSLSLEMTRKACFDLCSFAH